MEIFSKKQFRQKKALIKSRIKKNAVFIYPTDTIYGIGCSALSEKAVARVRKIKQRAKNPFSVIAPSKKWVDKNFILNNNAKKWLKKLPGPYTLILKGKRKCVAKNVAPGLKNVGIRIPKHWFSKFVKELGIPIITTSVNKSKEKSMTSLDDLDKGIKNKVGFIIYEGAKKGRPSNIIDLSSKIKIIER